MLKWIKRIVFTALVVPMAMCQAQTEQYRAGVDYELLPQAIRTANPNKIEVNEVFHYGCIHCFNFEKTIHPWAENLDEDVDFQRTPAIWQSALEPYARAYYSAKLLKVLDKTHVALFEAIHVDRQPIRSEQDLTEFFGQQGVDEAKFSKVYNSFGVNSMIEQAKARAIGYRTQGTPEIVINGKYRVTTRMSKNFDGMLKVATFLIEKERRAL
ncbi:MAG: thiol:disulfide interchange protein DsbA/DsbL [Proteobacteria bacterium]|nr:thiol:disulfide interchange protein DsbA/DsbL [Pseudomonadota bacterium]MDA1352707.1 thiol:disulfide interchange protein DsbA/DsbL [Pseudomonadota bacterium]